MIVVECKKASGRYWGDALGIVVAIIRQNNEAHYIVDTELFVDPGPYSSDELTFVDKVTPSEWIETSHGDTITNSFPEWANDPYFYSNLLDDYDLEAHNKAREVLKSKVASYIEEEAIKRSGTLRAAKEQCLQKRLDQKLRLHRDRGYEKPDQQEQSDEATSKIQITLEDLYST